MPTLWNAAPIVSQYKSFMFGMTTLPYVTDLAINVDTAVPHASMALQTVPRPAPGYGEAAIKLDESVGSVSMGPKAVLM